MSRRQSGVYNGAVIGIRKNIDWVGVLPESEFELWEAPDETPYKHLRSKNIIEAVDTGVSGRDARFRTWRVTDLARDIAEDIEEERETMLPCGHSGLVNHGDHFECGFAPCEQQFDREEVNC